MFFVQNLPTMNILDLIFLSHVVSTVFNSDLLVTMASLRCEVLELYVMYGVV